MSGENKKKRGEAGKSNAKNIAFRYGGSKCDFSTKLGRTTHPRLGGSRFLNAMKFGEMIGHSENAAPSDRAYKAADDNMEVCPTVAMDENDAVMQKLREPEMEACPELEKRPRRGIVIRVGASYHDASVNGGAPISLTSTVAFTSRGNVHGLLRPTKDNNRASSLLIHALQKRGMFSTVS